MTLLGRIISPRCFLACTATLQFECLYLPCHSALTTFGYHEVIPILRKDGQEHKLPAFSICCSKCWQLYEQLHRLTCSNSLLHVCLVALHLCQSPEQALDPYWDMMCQMALERCVMQPHTLNSMGFPGTKPADLPIRDLFGESMGLVTVQFSVCSESKLTGVHVVVLCTICRMKLAQTESHQCLL